MKPLDTFCKNNLPKHARSALWPKKEEIFELAAKNYSSYQIVQFLKAQNIKTCQKNVSNFLKKHYKKQKPGATHTHNHQPAPARAPQSPAKAGVNSNLNNGAEARAEAENPNIVRGFAGVKIDKTHPLYIFAQKNKNGENND